MSKVTSKLQVTIPKVIAEQYGIKPGDEIEFVPAGEVIRGRYVTRPSTGWPSVPGLQAKMRPSSERTRGDSRST